MTSLAAPSSAPPSTIPLATPPRQPRLRQHHQLEGQQGRLWLCRPRSHPRLQLRQVRRVSIFRVDHSLPQ
ncbi:hypothetical protein QJS04_geneDACA015989 [Acorus gramineus]|uniref:Uncharacterized protein n=1 Tax=Acorus gramineus TaxID=55184 RepID=A0AAV9BIX1_ACOGR|nr:hypothetical protein QJS04_geneDACA015989 [Acorus gramineus]